MIPFFSIVLCTYNRAHLLPRAIQSVLAQVEQDWELVVVDDGSSDDTPSVLQNYASNDSRIRVMRHDNAGLARSRNAGIAMARGLFVTFLDSDDEYLPQHLSSRRIALLDSPAVQFLHGGIEVIGDPYVTDRHPPHGRIHISRCVVGGTFVVRRDVLNALGGFDLIDYAEDAALYERVVATDSILVAKSDVPTYRYYRDTPDSLCTTYNPGSDAQQQSQNGA